MRITKQIQQGYTLIELMIVVGVIGVLVSVSLPAYSLYTARAHFSEAILAVGHYRSAIIVQAHSDKFSGITDVDAGTNGIPPAVLQTSTSHGMDVVDGVISVTWMADGTELAGLTYVLAVQGVDPPLQWIGGGSCLIDGYC